MMKKHILFFFKRNVLKRNICKAYFLICLAIIILYNSKANAVVADNSDPEGLLFSMVNIHEVNSTDDIWDDNSSPGTINQSKIMIGDSFWQTWGFTSNSQGLQCGINDYGNLTSRLYNISPIEYPIQRMRFLMGFTNYDYFNYMPDQWFFVKRSLTDNFNNAETETFIVEQIDNVTFEVIFPDAKENMFYSIEIFTNGHPNKLKDYTNWIRLQRIDFYGPIPAEEPVVGVVNDNGTYYFTSYSGELHLIASKYNSSKELIENVVMPETYTNDHASSLAGSSWSNNVALEKETYSLDAPDNPNHYIQVQYKTIDNGISSAEKTLYLGKDGFLTGIDNISMERDANDETKWFDLQGREVLNPEKGLYIKKSGSKITKYIFR